MTLADPVDVRILDEIVTVLEAITSANETFYTDPRRVYRLYGNALEVTEIPALILTPLVSAHSHDCPNGLERMDLTFAITCVIEPTYGGALSEDWAEVDREIRRMAADVRKALLADPQRSSLAIDTIIKSTDVYQAVEGQPVASAELVVTVPFRHLTADPTAAR